MAERQFVRWFDTLNSDDVESVGGKNASLGEMIATLESKGIRVPGGFATTAEAYWYFIEENGIKGKIEKALDEMHGGKTSLSKIGRRIRRLFTQSEFPDELAEAISKAYEELCEREKNDEQDVAVRSSATAEDLPNASFAGQQETYLNISGAAEVLDAVKRCFASLFTDRAISYREEQGFEHMKVALSAGIQKMVHSDKASAGVMFSLDTDTGFKEVVLINGAWGLGENVVQGAVNPDEFRVFKPLLSDEKYKPIVDKTLGSKEKKMVYSTGGTKTTKNMEATVQERNSFVLNDDEILTLARWGAIIEDHYDKPMDMEWAKDGETGEMFIVQARPETVQSRLEAGKLKTYSLKERGDIICQGLSIGDAIASGNVDLIKSSSEIDEFEEGSILVTTMTDPDWVPIMKKAAGIVTDSGGRTCHAAIVSRELGIPAVVGTGDATDVLAGKDMVTISCAEGDKGYVYEGELEFDVKDVDLTDIPDTETRIMMNVASPSGALSWWQLPAAGIGLARMEFIINNIIKIHPMALVGYDDLKDEKVKKHIDDLTKGYEDKTEYFVDHLARGIAKIACSQYPEPVVLRMSDFKTNEYADLIGGEEFEPGESNPMLGFRGASRYYSDAYRAGFALECRAVKRAREEIGMDNVIVMIPFCRTLEEADKVLDVLAENGLKRGEKGLQVYVMCEIPSNVILCEDFAEKFDGFSIGSNDLTQLVLGVDRDNADLANLFDERNDAVKNFIADLIKRVHKVGGYVGICGQAPSDYPEFAEFLVEQGIDSMSLNPDSVVSVKRLVAEKEAGKKGKG